MTLKMQSLSGPSLVFAVTVLAITAANAAVPLPNTHATHPPPAVSNYQKLPLSFEANQGQTDPSVRYISRGEGFSLFLTDSAAVLALGEPSVCASKAALTDCATQGALPSSIVRMTLAGASKTTAVRVSGEDKLPGKVNYFLGNDPTRWHTDLPTYAKVRYAQVYPGVDLVYYGNQRQLEYDFVVATGANPTAIRLNLTGEKHLRIAANGDLLLEGARGSATLLKPVVYQEHAGQRQPIPGSFRLLAKNTVSFAIGSYDHNRPLIIDPVLVYSSYLGGSGANGNGDQGNGIAVDSAGNAYVVGTTYSTNFPLSTEPFQSQNNAALAGHGSTVFVTKFDATGTALLYSSYLGGSGSTRGDFGYGIALDSKNNVYVTGATYSTDFPVTCGAFQTTNSSTTSGAPTVFVAKLSPLNNALAYSTYLGGSGNHATTAQGDVAQAIAVDKAGNAYVTGYTWSTDFPVTALAFQATTPGGGLTSNAFVTKVSPTGTALVFSTFLGGSGSNGVGDYANGIAINAAGDAFVTGSTASSNFPVTAGSFQMALNGSSNAFVTELKADGTDEVYSTYLGGTGGDSAQAIAIDGQGFAYVAGNTTSSDFPLTAGVLEGANSGIGTYLGANWSGAFVSKLKTDGTALEYSTYLEGLNTTVTGLAVDSSGSAYVVGNAGASGAGFFSGFQQTPDALPSPAYLYDSAFLVKLNPSAAVLNYATLLGGSSHDGATALALDTAGNAYLTGGASSTDFPTTSGAFQTKNKSAVAGTGNAFVSKFELALEANQTAYPAPSTIPTTMTDSGAQLSVTCYPGDATADSWTISVSVSLSAATYGPPMTGTVGFSDGGGNCTNFNPCTVPVSPDPGPSNYFFTDGQGSDAPWTPFQVGWFAYYSGDSVYGPSSDSGSASSQGCPPPTSSVSGSRGHAPHIQLHFSNPQGKDPSGPGLSSISAKLRASAPKFTPEPAVSQRDDLRSHSEANTGTQATTSCIAPKPSLTVTLQPAYPWRLYGAANPPMTYSVGGLIGSDTVVVAPQTVATPASPVGSYPVSATVSGPNADKYTITVRDATLSVYKAPLYIAARNEAVTYGQTPAPPTAYTLTGFVNGDTSSVVS